MPLYKKLLIMKKMTNLIKTNYLQKNSKFQQNFKKCKSKHNFLLTKLANFLIYFLKIKDTTT